MSVAWGTPAAAAAVVAPPTASVRTIGPGRPATPPTAQRAAGRLTGGAARTRAASAGPDGKVGGVFGGRGFVCLVGLGGLGRGWASEVWSDWTMGSPSDWLTGGSDSCSLSQHFTAVGHLTRSISNRKPADVRTLRSQRSLQGFEALVPSAVPEEYFSI